MPYTPPESGNMVKVREKFQEIARHFTCSDINCSCIQYKLIYECHVVVEVFMINVPTHNISLYMVVINGYIMIPFFVDIGKNSNLLIPRQPFPLLLPPYHTPYPTPPFLFPHSHLLHKFKFVKINYLFLCYNISFSLFTFPSASRWIYLLFLDWLPCHLYRLSPYNNNMVIEDKRYVS